jgi:hypothetical protein
VKPKGKNLYISKNKCTFLRLYYQGYEYDYEEYNLLECITANFRENHTFLEAYITPILMTKKQSSLVSSLAYSLTLEMKAICFFEMLGLP